MVDRREPNAGGRTMRGRDLLESLAVAVVRAALAVCILALLPVYAVLALVAWPCACILSACQAGRPPVCVAPVDAMPGVGGQVATPA